MTSETSNYILIGPMGAGKSTVGKALATRLDYEFYDSDREIELISGVDIPTIFEFEEESGFRKRENRMLSVLCEKNKMVLATGGGAVLAAENRHLLRNSGTVIYLQISIDEQLKRIAEDKRRPLMNTPDPRARLETLAQQRLPLYEEIADVTVNTDGHNVRTVVEKLIQLLKIPDQI